jgi:hypothetical protein
MEAVTSSSSPPATSFESAGAGANEKGSVVSSISGCILMEIEGSGGGAVSSAAFS